MTYMNDSQVAETTGGVRRVWKVSEVREAQDRCDPSAQFPAAGLAVADDRAGALSRLATAIGRLEALLESRDREIVRLRAIAHVAGETLVGLDALIAEAETGRADDSAIAVTAPLRGPARARPAAARRAAHA